MKRRFTGAFVGGLIALCLLVTGCPAPQQPVPPASPQVTASAVQTTTEATPSAAPTPAKTPPQGKVKSTPSQQGQKGGKCVDLVICLDTSNSMDALINSAKQKLWDIVNEVAELKPTPKLRVALISYGNDGYDTQKGWIRIDSDFSTNLDTINEKLFALHTNGGTEYVTGAVSAALKKLSWTDDKGSLRMVFVAGNEPATQDPKITIGNVTSEALQRDVVVNAIYCGAPESGEAQGWRDVAVKGGGSFFAINQEAGTVVVNTPYDQQLSQLSGDLNSTYVAYGPQGGAAIMNQAAQDSNSQKMSGYAGASRAKAKVSEVYNNKEWDLVDASKEGSFKLEAVKKQDLPAPMQQMNNEEQKKYIEKMAAKRKDLQQQIKDLSAKRDEYIKGQKKTSKTGDSFDAAVKQSIQDEAVKKGFSTAP
ncbi:MAG: VWA domain-containing protein [Candidatus Eremiobacteraeota bacterium]|nr:VWA domain-containing protein [Candidatus Eremiobacteraeota bacterium]